MIIVKKLILNCLRKQWILSVRFGKTLSKRTIYMYTIQMTKKSGGIKHLNTSSVEMILLTS